MKTISSLLLGTLWSLALFGQVSIDEKPLHEIDVQYLQMCLVNGVNGFDIQLLYGVEERRVSFERQSMLRDKPGGHRLFFNNAIHAINYMYEQGYQVDEMVQNAEGDVQFYLLRKIQVK